MTYSHNAQSIDAIEMLSRVQDYFVMGLSKCSHDYGDNQGFKKVSWLRNEGKNGGGIRYEALDEDFFNRASVNLSQVHYSEDKSKKLEAASALSTIIHPRHPKAPSMHMHISWTQMKEGGGYWRIMADLNPAIVDEKSKEYFSHTLKQFKPELYEVASGQGDRYFYIPALKRHRGVSHYYLEHYNSGDFETDKKMAEAFAVLVIDTYLEIVSRVFELELSYDKEDEALQLAYHTLYFFQVLTLDRGTTSGLLIHDQNDIGIMGSIPRFIDNKLLKSWIEKLPAPQNELLEALCRVLGDDELVEVERETKKALAQTVRHHYKKYPDALKLQASGFSVPHTVANHTR